MTFWGCLGFRVSSFGLLDPRVTWEYKCKKGYPLWFKGACKGLYTQQKGNKDPLWVLLGG